MFNWPLMVNNIEREDLDLLIEHLKQDDPKLTNGPKVKEFEEIWSKWLGVKYSVMVNSGASANDLTMKAIYELYGPGEVIVPPLTWVSDIASVIHSNLTPVFIDINFENLSFNLEELRNAITDKTRAIFITHVLGLNAISEELLDLCKAKEILLIEDVCESHGASFKGQKAGSLGFASNFSFYYAHHMTTIEGGMISTNDFDFYQTIRMMRAHGMVRESDSENTRHYYKTNFPDLNPDFIFAYGSHNMRPNELNGILGISQIKRLDANIIKRTKNFRFFLNALDSKKFYTEFQFEGSSNYALPIILRDPSTEKQNAVEMSLMEAKVEFRRGLSGGGNQIRQPYLKKLYPLLNAANFPIVDHIHFFSWYIGNFPQLEESQINTICSILNQSV
jgi:CDP-6-deoxy-D-xylo-4-hexulose-3-dehydrase